MTRVLQDLESLLAGPSTTEGIGDIGESVLVERTRDRQSDDDRQPSGDRNWDQFVEPGGDRPDDAPDQRADDREPRNDSVMLDGRSGPDRNSCEELDRAQKPVHGLPVTPRTIP